LDRIEERGDLNDPPPPSPSPIKGKGNLGENTPLKENRFHIEDFSLYKFLFRIE
jgi:hypothetical protein